MDILDAFQRIWENLIERPSGPMAVRLIIQPLVAVILAIRDGINDGRAGRSPDLWIVLTKRKQRRAHLVERLKATSKPMSFAFVLDTIYQLLVLKAFYPGEALIIAVFLGFLPYVLVRGPVARSVHRKTKP